MAVPMRVQHWSWRLLHAPRIERRIGAVDVVHATDLLPPPSRCPRVLTVHDVDAVGRPDLHGRRAVHLQGRQLAAARRGVDAVVAVSQATADALAERGVDPDRIHVVHHGVTPLPAADASAVPARPYVLAVATLNARKGLGTLVGALARAGVDLAGVDLVVAGPDGDRADAVRRAVADAGLGDRVHLPGRVSDAQLAALYGGAVAFCLPSIAEGFGLPVLEAMAAGAPVIASDLPVVREVAADAAVLVAVGDADAWADAIRAVLTDDDRASRLRQAGRRRAARFTWEAAAEATAAVYARVTGRPQPAPRTVP